MAGRGAGIGSTADSIACLLARCAGRSRSALGCSANSKSVFGCAVGFGSLSSSRSCSYCWGTVAGCSGSGHGRAVVGSACLGSQLWAKGSSPSLDIASSFCHGLQPIADSRPKAVRSVCCRLSSSWWKWTVLSCTPRAPYR